LEAKFTEMKDKHSKLWEDIGKVSYKWNNETIWKILIGISGTQR
jgi:hypothetical protein